MDLPDPLITVSPEYLGGAPVFTDTRVPLQALFDYIEGGDPLDEFLEDFPNVAREHAVAVVELARIAACSQSSAFSVQRVLRPARPRLPPRRRNEVAVRRLLDNCSPRRLAKDISGLDVAHVLDLGWDQHKDEELRDAMAGKFAVLVTVDRSLPFQQRFDDRLFAVIVLRARSNRIRDLQPLLSALLAVLADVKPGEVRKVSGL